MMPRLQHMERERVTKWPSMRSEKFSAEGRRISGEKFSFVAVELKEVVAGFNICRTVCQGAVDGWADGSGRDKKLCTIGVTTICPRGSASVMMGRGPRSEPWGTPLGDNEIYLGNMSGGLSG